MLIPHDEKSICVDPLFAAIFRCSEELPSGAIGTALLNLIRTLKEKNMVTKLKTQTLAARSYELITSWREYAPEASLADRTLAQFEVEKLAPGEIQQRIDTAKAVYLGLIVDRDRANTTLRKTLVMVANAIRATAAYGPDSAFYRSLGFVVDSERKRPARTRVVAPVDPPAANAA